jgi:DNA-binding response OmpR family regulator
MELAGTIRLALSHGAFKVESAANSIEAAKTMHDWRPHLVIVEMELDEGRLMAEFSSGSSERGHIPVIALTSRGDLGAKLLAWNVGVDDILSVPFSPDELVARTIAVVRRAHRTEIELTSAIQVGELEIDVLRRRVSVGGYHVHLTAIEEALLYLLAGNAGRVLTRDEILDAVWGVDYVAESNVVDKHIRSLRVKLRNSGRHPRYIYTVPGKGYRFVAVSS